MVDPPVLSKDIIFDLLRVERRRLTLQYLRSNEFESSLSELTTVIAAEENDISVTAVSSDQRKRVYIALYQSHLPKLDDAGVVNFDSRQGSVKLAANADFLYPYLDLEQSSGERSPPLRHSDSWRQRLPHWLPAVIGRTTTELDRSST